MPRSTPRADSLPVPVAALPVRVAAPPVRVAALLAWGVLLAATPLLLGGLAPAPLAAQGSWNVELLSRPTPGQRDTYAAVWGYTAPDSTELAFIGTLEGTSIFDVTNPRQPLWVDDIPGPRSRWREMQTWSHYLYIVTEGTGPESRGMQIVDLADPQAPQFIGDFDSTFVTAHTIHLRDGYAYINGTNEGWRILDLADPRRPRDVGGWNARYTHDCFVRGDVAYLANINSGGFTILDIADRSEPREVAFVSYAGAATHNCWTTEDGRFLLTTDENAGGRLRIWNVENPRAAVQVGEWSANPVATVHNVVVRGDSAYVAYYTEGLQVLDISQPGSPQLVGSFDTWPGVSGGYNGNWGVYPFARNNSIYLSDITSGLFVVRLGSGGQPVLDFQVGAPAGQTAAPGQTNVWFFFDLFNGAGGARTYDLRAANTAGWPMEVPPSITVPRNATEAVLVTVQVPADVAGPERVDVELCVRNQTSGYEKCVATRLAVPVLLQDFAVTREASGVHLAWRLVREDGASADAGGADAGGAALRIERTPTPAEPFELRARLPVESGEWFDALSDARSAYVYRLVLEDPAGERVLAERAVAAFDAPDALRSRLVGNVPNPFNPSTSIRFELARGGDVQIVIQDVRGRRLRALHAAGLAPGRHGLVWDGRDAGGRTLPSGVYLYEVQSGAWHEAGRMVLAK